jgi:8-oxo-dGTP pyrophosphatase MutT (NUDIX family)
MTAASRVDREWLARLAARLDAAPRELRFALSIRGADSAAVVIGSIEPALAARMLDAGLPLRQSGDGSGGWLIEGVDTDQTNSALADIAQWLHANGLSAPWRGELLAVTDESGASVGVIERSAVRPLGIPTFAVHLIAHDEQGQVWVQQRAFDKATDPGQWDTTMGGLASASETLAQTLERETWEEAGLRIDDLREVRTFGRFTVRRPTPEGYMVEHIDMFETVLPHGTAPVNQDGEVERFECLDRATLIERLHADAFTLEAGMILADWLVLRERDGR